jgi:hypothetical protein
MFAAGSVSSVKRGERVTIPISVSGNPGFATVGLVLSYDRNVLEIIQVDGLVAGMPLSSEFRLTSSPGTQWIRLLNMNDSNWSGNGDLVNVTFNVKANAAIGQSAVQLGFTSTPDGTPVNVSQNALTSAGTASGYVTVIEPAADNVSAPAPQNGIITFVDDPSGNKTEVIPGTPLAQAPAGTQSFGRVPQTSVPGMTGFFAGLCVSLAISIALYVFLFRKRLKGNHY